MLYARYGRGLLDEEDLNKETYKKAYNASLKNFETKRYASGATIASDDSDFNEWLQESQNDLSHLVREYETGSYPHAGLPWFNTIFGRDGIITAYQVLWLNPDIAKGVLKTLAARQAQTTDPFHDAEPGKIIHEARSCEMALTKEVPFGDYYGGVDETELFIMLAADHYKQTGDIALVKELKPHLIAANQWIENKLKEHPLGFLSYERGADTGLANQGWKDSADSVFHEDGSDPSTPIALGQVQGYVYAAWQGMVDLLEALREPEEAQIFRQKAKAFAKHFDEYFWDESLATYVLAIDGNNKPCRLRTSDTGHLLWTGIVPVAKAALVRDQLMSAESFSGYGIRTLAKQQERYDPLSYHNGSIWAHDTAIAALGLAHYGFADDAVQIFKAIYEAAKLCTNKRIPELFGGQGKDDGEELRWYHSACTPQAWVAGSVFMLLQAVIGADLKQIEQQVNKNNVTVLSLFLPSCCGILNIENMKINNKNICLEIKPAKNT